MSLMRQIAAGITSIHYSGLCHCDLKPQNILIELDGQGSLTVAITDFGITRFVDETNLNVKAFSVSNVKGATVDYAAPELLLRMRGRNYPLKLAEDLYAYGVILFQLLTQEKHVWY